MSIQHVVSGQAWRLRLQQTDDDHLTTVQPLLLQQSHTEAQIHEAIRIHHLLSST